MVELKFRMTLRRNDLNDTKFLFDSSVLYP